MSLCLRLLSVVLVFPVILIYIALLTVVGLLNSSSARSRTPLRPWMSVMDWVKGIPVGYSYWSSLTLRAWWMRLPSTMTISRSAFRLLRLLSLQSVEDNRLSGCCRAAVRLTPTL